MNHYKSLCRFEITPAQGTTELFQYLSQKGFYQSSFHTALYSIPREGSSLLPSNITIRKLQENEFDIFADIYVHVDLICHPLQKIACAKIMKFYNEPGWHFFIAEVQNIPAGICSVYK